ncbi:MAG: sugar phosphate isomerase/epimerase family protein [Candidatus Bipolaricaulia bacterium]
MKLACNTLSYNRSLKPTATVIPASPPGDLDLFDLIERFANELRVGGIEIDGQHIVDRSSQTLKQIKRTCIDNGLTIASVTAYTNFGYRDPTQIRSEIDKVKAGVDLAVRLGTPILRIFAGRPEESREAQWGSMIEGLSQAAEVAESVGVVLGMENHNDDGFAESAEAVERIFSEVGSPWLRLNLDTGNYLDGLRSIEKTIPYTVHIHLKFLQVDEQGREMGIDYDAPPGESMKVIVVEVEEHGEVMRYKQYMTNLTWVFDALREQSYRGFVSVEYEGQEEAGETAVPRAVEYVRRLIQERFR